MRYFSYAAVLAATALTFTHFTPANAENRTYTIDTNHTDVIWGASHFGFSNSHGKFSDVTGSILLDTVTPAKSAVNVVIKTASVVTGIEKFDAHLRGNDFFASDEFPEATFVSKSVTPTGEKTADVAGELTLRGVTKPVVLKAVLNNMGVNPYNKKETVGFNADTVIKRSEFGISYALPGIPDEVTITIAAEATMEKETSDSGAVQLAANTMEDAAVDTMHDAESAMEKAKAAAEDSAAEAEDTAEAITDAGEETAEDAADATENAAASAENSADDAVDTAGDMMDNAADATSDAMDATGDALNNAGDATADAAENAMEATGDTLDDAADATSDAVDATGDALDNAGDATADAAENAGDTVGDWTDKASEAAKSAYESAVGAWNNLVGDAEETADDAEDAAEKMPAAE